MLNIIGLMSGTSFDGVDIARLETDGENSLKFGETLFVPYPDSLKNKLKTASQQNLRDILIIEAELSEIYAKSVNQFLNKFSINACNIDYVVMHGQTIFHDPALSITSQLGNPHILKKKTGINVIHDLRRKDMANGGVGAPIVPIFHKAISNMYNMPMPIAFLNIGGVSNITYISTSELIAFDTGTGGAYIDDAMRHFYNRDYDDMGSIARSGTADNAMIERFLQDSFFQNNKYPKSLDRESFKKYYDEVIKLPKADSVRTFTEFTAKSVALGLKILPTQPTKIITCGGSRKNQFLVELIEKYTNIKVVNIDKISIDGDYVEAWAMAYIGARIVKNLPYTFPSTTGYKI